MRTYFAALSSLVLLVLASRVLPHPPNFTPVVATCLFGASHFRRRWQAFVVPLVGLLLGDLVLGFHDLMWAVYASFALITVVGWQLRSRARCAVALVPASLFFYFATNTAYWWQSPFYAKSGAGLLSCLVAALPFLGNQVAGDLSYGALLFGLSLALDRAWPNYREQRLANDFPLESDRAISFLGNSISK